MPCAVVLSVTKYSDTGTIVHLYTADHGRMQYMFYGNKYKSIFRPLSIVEYTILQKNNSSSCEHNKVPPFRLAGKTT